MGDISKLSGIEYLLIPFYGIYFVKINNPKVYRDNLSAPLKFRPVRDSYFIELIGILRDEIKTGKITLAAMKEKHILLNNFFIWQPILMKKKN